MGNTATHRGGVLPGGLGKKGRGRPVGSDRTCKDVPVFVAKPSSPAHGVDRDARDEPADGHRQARDPVRRRARNQVAAAKRCRYTKAGNVRSARRESGALQGARVAEAGCPLSVQVSARRDRSADQLPVKAPVNRGPCGWQVILTDRAMSWPFDVRTEMPWRTRMATTELSPRPTWVQSPRFRVPQCRPLVELPTGSRNRENVVAWEAGNEIDPLRG